MKRPNFKKAMGIAGIVVGVTAMICIAYNKAEKRCFKNAVGKNKKPKTTIYEKYVKRILDILIALFGIIIAAPILFIQGIIIFIDDPGSIVFSQKRIGIHKTYFKIHKARTMRLDTPDIPTHELKEPDKYLLRSGRFLRRHSLDELFQLFDILRGSMSVVGPRPALWNQDDLIAERDAYGANDIKPGLTGWAQINGRDELTISDKARLDGVYTRELKKSSLTGFVMDCRCLWGTAASVLKAEGIAEGGISKPTRGMGMRNKIDTEKAACEKRLLGNTGIGMTVLGFGCASVWGKRLISDDEATRLFERAYELGIRYFDTGYSYGIAEERIGNILKKSTIVDRDEIIISSKFGTKLVNGKYIHDWSPQWMRSSVEISLSRMGISYLDLLMCHGPQIADITETFLDAMRCLKKDGLVKAIGINTFDTEVIAYVRDTKCFDFVMLDYNIMRQDREKIIQELYEGGIGVIAGAPLAESLYSNRIFKVKHLKDIWYLARAVVNHRDKLAQRRGFSFINKVPDMSGTQAALRYVLDNKCITSAVFGTTTLSHLEENVGALDKSIPQDVLQKIKAQGCRQ